MHDGACTLNQLTRTLKRFDDNSTYHKRRVVDRMEVGRVPVQIWPYSAPSVLLICLCLLTLDTVLLYNATISIHREPENVNVELGC